MRLLLVECDPMIGASVQSELRQEGYPVNWVRHGAAAELALASSVHELILLDLGLPRKTGLELPAGLRRNTNSSLLPSVTSTPAARILVRPDELVRAQAVSPPSSTS